MMLPKKSINYSALASFGLLLILLISSSRGGRAQEEEKEDKDGGSGNKTVPTKIPALPEVDSNFKRLLDSILGLDRPVTTHLARYMDVAPSSHKSRSLVTNVFNFNFPVSALEGYELLKTTEKPQTGPRPKRRPNPLKKVVELLIEMGNCTESEPCSDTMCDLMNHVMFKEKTDEKKPAKANRSAKRCSGKGHCGKPCDPCPVPNFCPMIGFCGVCPGKPKCPCGEQPTEKLVEGKQPSDQKGKNETANHSSDRSLLTRHHHKHKSNRHHPREEPLEHGIWWPLYSSTTTRRPPCAILGTCTSSSERPSRKPVTTTRKSNQSTTSSPQPNVATTPAAGSTTSTTPKTPGGSSTTPAKGGSSTTSTTPKTNPSTSTTQKTNLSTSTTPKTSSSTTSTTPKSRTSTTEKSPSSTTSSKPASSTSSKPASSTSTKPASSTSSMKPSAVPSSTTTRGPMSSSKRPTDSAASSTSMKPVSSSTTSVKPNGNGATTKKAKNGTITERTSGTAEQTKTITKDGKTTTLVNRTETENHLEYLQLENGLKILLRNTTVVKFVIDAINSMPLRAGGLEGRLADKVLDEFGEDRSHWIVHRKNSRAMTFGTLRMNLIHILRHLVVAIVQKKCSHCVDKCKSMPTTAKPAIECNEEEQDKYEEEQAQNATASTRHRSEHSLCEPCWSKEQVCPAPAGCKQYSCKYAAGYCPDKTATTKGPNPTGAPQASTTAIPNPTGGPSSTKSPDGSTATTSTPPVIDPDFQENDPARYRVNHRSGRSSGHDALLTDMDPKNQIKENDRFRELPCNGSICADQKTCGEAVLNELTPKKKQSGYIINGKRQKYGEWPSYARLDITLDDKNMSMCGGVLIGKRHVLTAGHCVRGPRLTDDEPNEGPKLKAQNLEVVMGEHRRWEDDEFETRHKVENICFSSKFNDPKGEGSRFDFAILTLADEVQLNDHVQPACLPYKPFPVGGSKCYVVGQGYMLEDDSLELVTSEFVQKMPVARKLCQAWGFNEHDRSRWCFTRSNGEGDSCNGDSGGPILCLGKDQRWYIMGLVSYGSEECDGAEGPGWVAVYTRVPAILEQMHLDCLNET